MPIRERWTATKAVLRDVADSLRQSIMLNLGEQFGNFSQVILELGFRIWCHVGSHVVRVLMPVLLAVHTQVGSQQHRTQLQLAIPSV